MQGKIYKSSDLPEDFNWEEELTNRIGAKDSFNQVLTVSNVPNPLDVYRLHKYFCYLELDQISLLMTNIEEGIFNSTLSAEESVTWPAGKLTILDFKSTEYSTLTVIFLS